MGVAAELQERLDQLERERSDGSISELTYTVRRNLLVTRADQTSRRRATAARLLPPPAPPPPPRRRRGGGVVLREGDPREGPVHLPQSPVRALGRVPQLVRWVGALLIGIALIAVVAGRLGAAGTTPATSATPPPTGGATPAAEGPSPPTSASPPASGLTAIGVTQATASGGTVTVIAYADHFEPSSLFNNPLPPGGFYAAVDLRVCAAAGGTVVSPFDFNLVEPDRSQLGVASGPTLGKQPELQLEQLAGGTCATGWLSYGVTARPASVVDTADGLTWSIPPG